MQSKISCEICTDNGFNLNSLLDHYNDRHNIGKDNPTLIEYLTTLLRPNKALLSRCLVCEDIFDSVRQKSVHLLRNHSNLFSAEIGNLPVKASVELVGYEINKLLYTVSIYRSEHFYDYDWHNSSIINAFLSTSKLVIDSLRIKEVPPSKNITVTVSYSIVNKDTRSRIIKYLPVRSWSTTAIKTISLNPAVMENLTSQIKAKIIQNGESGSHIAFSHFKSFKMTVSVLDDEDIASIFGGDDEQTEAASCSGQQVNKSCINRMLNCLLVTLGGLTIMILIIFLTSIDYT